MIYIFGHTAQHQVCIEQDLKKQVKKNENLSVNRKKRTERQ